MSKLRGLSFRKASKEKTPLFDISAVSPTSTSSTYSPSSLFSPSGSVLSSPLTISSPLDLAQDPFQSPKIDDSPPPYALKSSQNAPATDARTRLLQIANQFGVLLTPTRPRLTPQNGSPTYMTNADTQDALKLLAERRQSDPEYKAPSGLSKLTKSKAKIEEFSSKEINRAFRAVVLDNGSLRLVEAFLGLGADVDVSRRASTNMWKKMTKKDQNEQRSDVLQEATRGGNVKLVQLLAARANQVSRDEALIIAIYQHDLEKVQMLLEFDASIYEAHDVFLSAIDNAAEDLVELVLLAPKLPCRNCQAQGLVKAAEKGSLRMTSALLFSDADTNYDNARAMTQAARSGDVAVAVAIAGCHKPPSSANLDQVAAVAYETLAEHDGCLLMMEICLCSGARGRCTEQVLCFATERDELDTVELLLRHGVSVDYQNGRALITAIEHESESMFTAIMGAKANDVTLGNALIVAISSKKLGLDFCERLLEKGASVNYDSGRPLVTAIKCLANEILRTFLSRPASKLSLVVALEAALRLSGINRMSVLSLLLPSDIEQTALDEGLITLVREEPNDLEAVEALLNAGASADHKNGLCVVDAARRFELRTLETLQRAVVSKGRVFSLAAAAAVADNTQWLQPEGLAVLQFLLESGAMPSILNDALRQATVLYDIQALQFLADWIEPGDIYTLAFSDAIEVGEKWCSPRGLDVVRLLLEKGASGEIVHGALLQAQERFVAGHASEALVDTLLEYRADVNYDDGHAVELAVKAGNVALLEKLFNCRPTQRTLSMAFSAALISGHPTQKVLNIVNALVGKEGEIADPNFVVPGMDPPIFLALQHYPTSVPVVKRLMEIGCTSETKIRFKVFGEVISDANPEDDDDLGAENRLVLRTARDDLRDQYDTSKSISARMTNDEDGTPAEEVTVLVWACCQVGDQAVSAAVVDALLEFKADPTFITSYSKSSPLLLACRYERPDIVGVLLRRKINISFKDKFSRSALFFAAGNGDVKSIKILLQQKPRGNDGSLHEAARELHSDIMSLLLKAGHDPNFTSTKHEGLTPLGELCMYCNGKGLDSRIEECIELLVRAKIDPGKKWRGKSVLYMALDNPEPHPVTSALLERLMWKHVKNDANIYDDESLYYSPTMYLKKGYFLGSEDDQGAMIQLLKDHGAEDHYYAEEGLRQPGDAVGMPQHIVASERRRRQHEENISRKQEEHEASLRHQWEKGQQIFQLQEANQEQYLRHQDQRFEQNQNHMISNAYVQAQIQYQKDLYKLNTDRESAQIQVQRENHKLEVQWKSNRLQAQQNHDRVVTKQRLNRLDGVAQRQKVASNYQIQRQNVFAQGMMGNMQARSQANALAMKQQSTRLSLMAQYAKNQRSIGR